VSKFPDNDKSQGDANSHDATDDKDRRRFGVRRDLDDVGPDGEVEREENRVAQGVSSLRDSLASGQRNQGQPGAGEDR